ncbi:MAG: hypothetical protein OXG39_02405 [Chloroflexi bacterium]|nr:hypothetical protein [Chloroflexota bacterium]
MIQLSIPILNMLMDEDLAPTAVGDLVFNKLWARPASAGVAGHDDNSSEESASSK